MQNHNLRIEQVTVEQVLPVRQQVLWPNDTIESCIVDGDKSALHIAAYIEEKIVCVASIYTEKNGVFRLRKFATLEVYQGQGIGSKVINFIIKELTQQKAQSLWCDARETALSFYKKFDFYPISERFLKRNKAYYKIERTICQLD